MKLKLFFSAIFSCAMIANANATCPTHIMCSANSPCKCTIAANSAYDRSFYFNISDIGKGAHYQCDFTSNPVYTTLEENQSTFPKGSKYTYTNAGHTPYSINLDTTEMKNPADTMIVKFFIPASDYPSDVSATCKVVD